MKAKSPPSNQVYFSESDIDYDELTNICSQETLKDTIRYQIQFQIMLSYMMRKTLSLLLAILNKK